MLNSKVDNQKQTLVFSQLALQIPENCKQNKNYDKEEILFVL